MVLFGFCINSLVGLLIGCCLSSKSVVPRIYVTRCCNLTKFSSNPFLKMGAKPTTITGLSGTGDIMLTCFVNLSRNRTVGVRLGLGEKLDDILSSMNQVLKLLLLMLVKNCVL